MQTARNTVSLNDNDNRKNRGFFYYSPTAQMNGKENHQFEVISKNKSTNLQKTTIQLIYGEFLYLHWHCGKYTKVKSLTEFSPALGFQTVLQVTEG